MKKTSTLIIAIALVTLAAAAKSFISHLQISEHRYNKIMCYYIARNCTKDMDTVEKKICALREFVHLNVHPICGYHNRLDTVAIKKLISGIGWCDQQSRVFMQLAKAIGINTRLLFLTSANSSPHSIAEAQLPNGRWVIVDPLFNLELHNKNGELATRQDIKENPNIITNNDKIKLRKQYDDQWGDPDFIAIYYNPPRIIVDKKAAPIDFLRFVPLAWIRVIDKYIAQRYMAQTKGRFKDELTFKMAMARTLHLIGCYKESKSLYYEIITTTKDSYLRYKAEYYLAMLFKDQNQYDISLSFLSFIIDIHDDNPYEVYSIGLMSRILDEGGQTQAALETRKTLGFDLLPL